VEAVAGEVQPAWASIARPLYFVDDIDECVAAERERCAKVCEDSNTYDEYDPGGHFAELIRGSGPNVGNNRL
jgi:hypothetical protein